MKSDHLKDKETIIDEEQFVSFLIGDETYGVSVHRVQSIIGMTEITHVPKSAPFMKGVINLRGAVVPVIDLRLKFNMEPKDYDSTTVIIIVEVKEHQIGMIVDTVSDVLNIPVDAIQDTIHFSLKIETDFIEAIGQVDDRLVIILDIEKIMQAEDNIESSNENKNSA